ncbi:MAG TPA: hypothetical protein VFE32_02695 [Puia sp.]|jgi:hypothetical protein|nr:hypothetical protein [Puia sp.]
MKKDQPHDNRTEKQSGPGKPAPNEEKDTAGKKESVSQHSAQKKQEEADLEQQHKETLTGRD